jgi:hypothetical protein
MGYTVLKGGKIVIWTNKIFEAHPWPFNDEGDRYIYFYKNLRGDYFGRCLARESEDFKKEYVSELIDIPVDKIVLKSRISHMRGKNKTK